LSDWFLVFSGRIYRQPESPETEAVVPLAARTTWRVDQPRVIQRELRGYLTRTTAREVRNSPDKLAASIVVQQANYDPLGRNLASILPILSFHAHVGGTSYTGLSNDMLADYDLTPLMDLDRALLIGYLEQPASDLQLAGEADLSGRRTTLVRIVLPVERSKQLIKKLERVVPEN
jgi:hypothetical protein